MSSLHFPFCPCIFIFVLAFSFLSLHFHKNIKNHFVSYEYFRIVIWHGLNFEHFKNLENLEYLENLKNLDNWVLWTFWELTCSFRSILSSDLGLNSFESCFNKKCHCQTYQNYEQSWQKLGTFLDNKVL